MTNFVSSRFPNHGFSERFPECGVFGHIVEMWHTEEASQKSPHDEDFDDEAYGAIFTQITPEHLINFLHATFTTYEAANRFLAEALFLAQDHGWDT